MALTGEFKKIYKELARRPESVEEVVELEEVRREE
jgi:hypothetical protein